MPSITIKDYDLLRRIMALTASDNDGEALSAIRRANEILARNSITWENVFRRTVTQGVEAAPEEHDPVTGRSALARQINDAFEIVTASDPGGDFGAFIDSLQKQWFRDGHLSEAQREALFKAERRALRDTQPRFRR